MEPNVGPKSASSNVITLFCSHENVLIGFFQCWNSMAMLINNANCNCYKHTSWKFLWDILWWPKELFYLQNKFQSSIQLKAYFLQNLQDLVRPHVESFNCVMYEGLAEIIKVRMLLYLLETMLLFLNMKLTNLENRNCAENVNLV